MPFEIKKSGSEWCVFTQGTGKKHGCHPSRAEAIQQMRALYANVPEATTGAKSFDSWDTYSLQISQDLADYNPVGGGTEKACANCQFFSSPDGCLIVQGDISPTGISRFWEAEQEYIPDPIAVEVTNFADMGTAGAPGEKAVWSTSYINNLPDSSFAYIEPGGKKDSEGKTEPRSLRHFPYKDSSGKVDLPHLRNALARAPQSPFGSKALPKLEAAAKANNVGSKSLADITTQAKDWLTSLFSKEEPPVVPAPEGATGLRPIYMTKDLDGSMRGHLIMSNNFEDRHGQIIPEVVHQEYIDWVDRTKLYPEFQVWHMGAKSRWGQADCVTRIGNFTLVSGPVDPGKELLAEAFANDPNTGVSNGYYALYTPDKKEFLAWYPFEASALPLAAAANVWMGESEALESEGYLLKPEHKALLVDKGVPPEFLVQLETDILRRGVEIGLGGIASKAVATKDAEDKKEAPETPGETPDAEDKAEGPEPTGPVDVHKAIQDAVKYHVKAAFDPMSTAMANLEKGQKAIFDHLKMSDDDKIANAIQAEVGTLPQGYKATEATNNTPSVGTIIQTEAELQKEFNWLDNVLDDVMVQNGIKVGAQ